MKIFQFCLDNHILQPINYLDIKEENDNILRLGHYLWVKKKIFSAADFFATDVLNISRLSQMNNFFLNSDSVPKIPGPFKWGYGERFSRYLML